jgi:ABC-type nitrate/sulfonate/bicarbonate transport system permease component
MRRALVALVWIVGAWYLLTLVAGARVVPPPHVVALRFGELLPSLLVHAGASLLRVLAALALAGGLALPVGLAMGRSRRVDRLFAPVSYLLYPVPKIALLPVLLLVLGAGDLTRIVLVALVLFFQMLLAVRDGARAVDEHYLLSIDSLGGTRLDRLLHVIWPSVLPRLLTAMRIGSATALAVLFFAETFFTRRGLGYFIMDGWMRLAYVDMYAGIVTMSLLGLALFVVIDRVDRRVNRWQRTGS